MKKYYLAIDIGASSGRHILGYMEDNKMVTEEIYRFANGMIEKNGHLCWDIERLFDEILNGLKECKRQEKIPYSIAIDTWAVDYVLLDGNNQMIGDAVAYRDDRTKGIDADTYQFISEEALYQRTGIQKQLFNTVYQLMSLKKNQTSQLEQAASMLMIPEYFSFLLTGNKAAEYTNATTTQLVSPETKDWNYELIEQLGLPKKVFQQIRKPGYNLGHLSQHVQNIVGFDSKVVFPATHDTGSAVISVPSNEEHTLYISSGTWSLMGTELHEANCSLESMKRNFTNEGGYDYRFRYLKNIMGLWMIQFIRKEIASDYTFGEICQLAEKEQIASRVDCNDARFLAPHSMTEEIRAACREQGMQIPQTIGEVAKVIYESLAECYAKTAEEIEQMTGVKYSSIYIVGGGANADYLNKLTAKATGKCVYAGPTEATAIGNIAVQMMADGVCKSLADARKYIMNSFEVKVYAAPY
ncbi:MAG: rhamnulokinase [Lachnospira sp.]|nr:rhamnulokinase [Lachnospira sp.]